jgi:hypothetical protein
MPRTKFLLKSFSYNTIYPVTVRQAALLNAVQKLTANVVYNELENQVRINSKKPKTDEIDAMIFILNRDSKWVKKMFMGANGYDVSICAPKKTKKQEAQKTKETPKKQEKKVPIKKKSVTKNKNKKEEKEEKETNDL